MRPYEQFRTGMVVLREILGSLTKRELVPLAGLLVCAFALLAFLKISDEVQEGETHAADLAILQALRHPGAPDRPIGPLWLNQAAQDITSLGSLAVLAFVTLVSAGYLVLKRRQADALLLLVAVPGGLLLSTGLKAFYDRPRPDLLPEAVAHLNASFPSGHAMLSAVTYLTLAALIARAPHDRRVKTYLFCVAIAAAVLVGLSRVYLGLHWPTDVLAGWCVGAAWAILCRLLADYFSRRPAL